MIKRIKLHNFKIFRDVDLSIDGDKVIFIGENGSGKSSILQAISLVINGSFRTVEEAGFQSLFNIDVIEAYMQGEKLIGNLPTLMVELFLDDNIKIQELNGIHNSEGQEHNGLCMKISPNDELSTETFRYLQSSTSFPFDFYKLEFFAFTGLAYNSLEKRSNFPKCTYIHASRLANKQQLKRFVEHVFETQAKPEIRREINSEYRELAHQFSTNLYSKYQLDDNDDNYRIFLDTSTETSFQDNISLKHRGIDLNNLGKGEQIIIATKHAINEKAQVTKPIVLMEEPENHLSYLNMKILIDVISNVTDKQVFIATHSNMIASRLDLRNAIFLHEGKCTNLKSLSSATSKYFIKAPDTNVLNFILAKKVVLVEGDAEYILLDFFFRKHHQCYSYEKDIAIIACGGKTFKRYIELATPLSKKIAIITDNDGDFQANVANQYKTLISDRIKVFSDHNNENVTFEVSLYQSNVSFYEEKVLTNQMGAGVLNFMRSNKTEAALRTLEILEKNNSTFNIPQYISDALAWISL